VIREVRREGDPPMPVWRDVTDPDTNDVMRTLAMYSVFFMPLTFIVGIYGMNFENIPELRWRFGYLGVWVALATVSFSLWRWFRRKRWI
jgi:magnesium transporter